MKIDAFVGGNITTIGTETAAMKSMGYDGVFAAEVAHDPFIAASLAADRADGMDVGTKIAVAFSRTPMTLAYAAHDVNELCGGNFKLGLGSQIKAHITRRFGMPWSAPAPRMREMILALRAIWDSWREGSALSFEGEYYHHTLMTPTFTPAFDTARRPDIWVAAVGPVMAEMAAEVSDGIILHGFWTTKYMDEVLLPAIEKGLAAAGRSRNELEISGGGFLATGGSAEAIDLTRERIRAQVAFYGSTPAYRGVLAVHGWGSLGDELHDLSVSRSPNKWSDMARLVTDEILDEFAIAVPVSGVAQAIVARNARYVDRLDVSKPDDVSPEEWVTVIRQLRA